MLVLLILLALIALIATAPDAKAQRGITDNPYPQTLKHPATTLSRTAQEKFYKDSLRAEFPVNSKGEPCWKFVRGASLPGGDSYFCFRERGAVLDSVSRYGNMATYFRGKWDNIVTDGSAGLLWVEWSEPGKALRSGPVKFTVDATTPKP